MTVRAVGGTANAYIVGSGTWAQISALTPATGAQALATDVGSAPGTWLMYTGTRWRPVGGEAVLKGLGATVSGIANTETIVIQTLLPANLLQTNDTIRVYWTPNKSGTTDSGNNGFRIGTAGTTADTSIYSSPTLATSNRCAGFIFDFKLTSVTNMLRVGNVSSTSGAYQGAANNAPASATVITDASVNALYFSGSISSSGTTDTVGIGSAQIIWIAP